MHLSKRVDFGIDRCSSLLEGVRREGVGDLCSLFHTLA